jgi:predicted nuclease of predicted toxin-antitoxin system
VKLIVDSCLSRRVARELSEAGHDVVWIGDGPGPGDVAILSRGFREGRVVLTLDKDFGELAELHGLPHAGIVRILNAHPRLFVPLFLQVLDRHGPDLLAGALATADSGRMRIRLARS